MLNASVSCSYKGFEIVEALLTEQLYLSCGIGAEATAADAQMQIAEQIGSGVQYPNLPHQSSAPGGAPVNQLGELLGSIHANLEPDIIGIGASADVDSEIGPYLEGGTSKMEPRPFMGPASVAGSEAVERHVETIPAELARALA